MIKLPEIIRLIKELQIETVQKIVDNSDFSPDNAEELFNFLYNYTNSFKNYNTTPEILRLAWNTLRKWISHDKIIIAKGKKTLNEMKFYSEIIKTIKTYKNGELIWLIVTKKIMEEFNLKQENINSFILNLLTIVAWTKFWFLVIENWDNESILYLIPKYKSEESEKLRKILWITYENKLVNKNYKEVLEIITK